MRILRLFVICLFLPPMTFLSAQSSLMFEIVNFERNKGVVIVDLLDQNEKSVKDQTKKIANNKCTMTFTGLKIGQNAIRFFHDENGNKKLDTNFLVIPREGFGFSNDAMGNFVPKDFNEWLFKVSGDTKIKMTANYMF